MTENRHDSNASHSHDDDQEVNNHHSNSSSTDVVTSSFRLVVDDEDDNKSKGKHRGGNNDGGTKNNDLYSCSKFCQTIPSSLWGGLGLFGESYLLFSIGTLKPLWEILFPDCLDTHTECSPLLTSSMNYGVVCGVIFGMILLGTLANTLGRRVGSITTASFMAIGSILLMLLPIIFPYRAPTLFGCMTATLFLFGIGVGGEYPLSAASASERAMQQLLERKQQQQEQQGNNNSNNSSNSPATTNTPKGRAVVLTFSMQGMGVFVNSLLQSLLLIMLNEKGNYAGDDAVYDVNVQYDNEDNGALGRYNPQNIYTIWKLIYFVGASTLVYVLIWRYQHLKESEIWLAAQRKKEEGTSHNNNSSSNNNMYLLSKVLKQYGSRLFGCSMCWLLWDIAFYGNKLFQSTFLRAVAGDNATLLDLSVAATLNSFVALCGYYVAAYIVDLPQVGRFRLQFFGFVLTGFLFLICGILSSSSSSGNDGGISPNVTIALYLGSSFFGQCGPNATTFLIPAEIFPTNVRTMCHGISASSGKVGALISAILFGILHSDSTLFYASAYSSLAAAVLTYVTIPDTTTLDLHELDLHWQQLTNEGENSTYCNNEYYVGPATNKEYLSLWEQRITGQQRQHLSSTTVNKNIELT